MFKILFVVISYAVIIHFMAFSHESYIDYSIKSDRGYLSPKVLIADVPLGIGSSLVSNLRDRGFELSTTPTWDDTVITNESETPTVIVADPQNLGVSYEDLVRLGKRLIITEDLRGRDESSTTVKALNAGADFFLHKPVSPDLLVAHIQALLRRGTSIDIDPIVHGAYGVDYNANTRKVTVNGKSVNLTRIEYSLLETMMLKAGKVMTHEELLVRVWGTNLFGDKKMARVYISKLRKKLESISPGSGSAIRTMNGIGYIFLTSDQQDDAQHLA